MFWIRRDAAQKDIFPVKEPRSWDGEGEAHMEYPQRRLKAFIIFFFAFFPLRHQQTHPYNNGPIFFSRKIPLII